MEEEKKNRPEEAADTAGETTADASQAETAETAAQETEADTREDAAEADASGGAEQTSGGTDDGSADTDKTDAKEPEKKKGFFGKKKDKKDEQIEELIDKNRRLMAEFDNYRKRTEKEKSAMFEVGARSMIERYFLLWIILSAGLPPFRKNRRIPRLRRAWKRFISRWLRLLRRWA